MKENILADFQIFISASWNNLDSQLVCIEATDKFAKNINVSDSKIDAIKLKKNKWNRESWMPVKP